MKVKKLKQEEHWKTRPLYEEVFSEDSNSFVEYYYKEKTKDNQIYIVEEEGEIQSMLHLNPYLLQVNQSLMKAHYIVAVATRQRFRGKGYMKALLQKAMEEMYEAKEGFTFLMPAAEAIYTPYDFRTVAHQDKVYKTSMEDGERAAKEEDVKQMGEWAEDYLGQHFQVYAKRDGSYYRRLIRELESDGSFLIYPEQGWNQEKICLGPKEEIPTSKPKIMIRLLHLETMFPKLKAREELNLTFEVEDEYLKENNQCYQLLGKKGEFLKVEKGDPRISQGKISIADLGEVLFGQKEYSTIPVFQKMEGLSKIFLNETV